MTEVKNLKVRGDESSEGQVSVCDIKPDLSSLPPNCEFAHESEYSDIERRLEELFRQVTEVPADQIPRYTGIAVLKLIGAVQYGHAVLTEHARRLDGAEDPELSDRVKADFPIVRFIGRRIARYLKETTALFEVDPFDDGADKSFVKVGCEVSMLFALCEEQLSWVTCYHNSTYDWLTDPGDKLLTRAALYFDGMHEWMIPAHHDFVVESEL